MINRIQIRHINVTVTSSASYALTSFTITWNSRSPSYKIGTFNFQYSKAIVSTWAQIAGNSTYCKSTNTVTGGGTAYYVKIECVDSYTWLRLQQPYGTTKKSGLINTNKSAAIANGSISLNS